MTTAASVGKQIKNIENVLVSKLGISLDKRTNSMMLRLEKALTELQQSFFHIMEAKITDVEKAPDLGKWTPFWAPLSNHYTDRKGHDNFYFYEGKMAGFFPKNALSYFGKPLVAFQQGALFRRAQKKFVPPKTVKELSQPSKLVIDVYPKVITALADPTLAWDLFRHKNPEFYYRVTNYQGSRDRDIVGPYMLWWLNVKVKAEIKRVMKT